MPSSPYCTWRQGSTALAVSTSRPFVSPSSGGFAVRSSALLAAVTLPRGFRRRTSGVPIIPARCGERLRSVFAHPMRVYEASLSFNLVQLGNDNKVDTPAKVVEYLASAFATNPTQEAFWVIMLDRKNRAIGRVMITLGTLTSSLVHPREVFRPAILASAAAIIVSHNHPSGVMPHPVLCRTETNLQSGLAIQDAA